MSDQIRSDRKNSFPLFFVSIIFSEPQTKRRDKEDVRPSKRFETRPKLSTGGFSISLSHNPKDTDEYEWTPYQPPKVPLDKAQLERFIAFVINKRKEQRPDPRSTPWRSGDNNRGEGEEKHLQSRRHCFTFSLKKEQKG